MRSTDNRHHSLWFGIRIVAHADGEFGKEAVRELAGNGVAKAEAILELREVSKYDRSILNLGKLRNGGAEYEVILRQSRIAISRNRGNALGGSGLQDMRAERRMESSLRYWSRPRAEKAFSVIGRSWQRNTLRSWRLLSRAPGMSW